MLLPIRHRAFALNLLAAAVLSAGCASAPPPPKPAPQAQSLAQYLQEASKAKSEQGTTKERDIYRQAARQYPTAKEPWSRLAESYFEATDYGNAILAAQEVLQRDGSDATAASVLAVSGLRVSTQALSTLRAQNSKLPVDTRSQAEGLTKTLRELLGESVLVPPVADAAPGTPAAAPTAQPQRRPPARSSTPNATPAQASSGSAAPPATATAPTTAAAPATKPAVKPAAPTAASTAPTATPAAVAKPAVAPAPSPAPAPAAKPAAPKSPFDTLK
jgi:hypothetical protein